MDRWFYCEDCRALFPEEDVNVSVIYDHHWWLDDCPTETFYLRKCPECGSENVEEAAFCDECGEVCLPEDLDENWLCAECRKKYEQEEKQEE